ncbi:MAG: hypothetical protein MRZ28_09670 [Oscillospiraceae bacterium]|nr:hypothetical protein [Oscillospiraceae bacterium]MDY3218752.1 hypothetical protein [Candidatus Fimivivens sp.]
MLDEKDLQAISHLLQSAVSESEERMSSRIESAVSASEKRMSARIESAASASEKRMSARIDTAISESENRLMTYIESSVEKKLQLLAEGHETILNHLPDVDEQAQLKSRVRVLERVVIDLRKELDELKTAQ